MHDQQEATISFRLFVNKSRSVCLKIRLRSSGVSITPWRHNHVCGKIGNQFLIFLLALCNQGCVHGKCIGVGVCRCDLGYFGPSCDRGPIETTTGQMADCLLRGDCDSCDCMNGGQCSKGR